MDIQQILVWAIVAVAFVSVGRNLWRQIKGVEEGDGCAGCGGACGKPAHAGRPAGVRAAPQATPLVTLSTGGRPARPTTPRPDNPQRP